MFDLCTNGCHRSITQCATQKAADAVANGATTACRSNSIRTPVDRNLTQLACVLIIVTAGVGDLDWREATARAGGPNNPNRLWPVAVSGFDELLKRKNAQVLQQQCQRLTMVSFKYLACLDLQQKHLHRPG